MDWKKYANNGFWGALGGIAGYFYGDSKSKERKWRRRTLLGGASLLTATVMLFNTGIPGCNRIAEKYLDNNKQIEIQKLEIEKEKIKHGYDAGKDSLKKEISEMRFQTEKIYSTIDGKVQGMDSKIADIKKNQSHILSTQKELSDNLVDIKDGIKKIEETPKTYNSPGNSSSQKNYSTKSYNNTRSGSPLLIVADKSEQKLTLWDDTGKKLYECPMIYAKTGGPENGRYKVQTVQPRAGELYPGVAKLTEIIVITGSGDNSQYDYYLDRKMNVNKTGMRTYNDKYNKLSSQINGRETDVLVRD